MIRYARFCLVGGSGLVVDVVLLYLLRGAHPSVLRLNLGKIAAAETAVVNNFVWNDRWTFDDAVRRGAGAGGRGQRFVRFNLISLSGLVITAALLNWQVYGLGMNVDRANVISIVLVSVWNFVLSARFGWRSGEGVSRVTRDEGQAAGEGGG